MRPFNTYVSSLLFIYSKQLFFFLFFSVPPLLINITSQPYTCNTLMSLTLKMGLLGLEKLCRCQCDVLEMNFMNFCTWLFFEGTLSDLRQFLATENPLKMLKNVFLFHLKIFFILKMFKFLSWLFGHVAKWLWLER